MTYKSKNKFNEFIFMIHKFVCTNELFCHLLVGDNYSKMDNTIKKICRLLMIFYPIMAINNCILTDKNEFKEFTIFNNGPDNFCQSMVTFNKVTINYCLKNDKSIFDKNNFRLK